MTKFDIFVINVHPQGFIKKLIQINHDIIIIELIKI